MKESLSALCNCNIYCNFPLPACFLGFFPAINTFPGLNLHSSSTQHFNSIPSLSLSLSSLTLSLSLSPSFSLSTYTLHLSPTIKLSFKDNPSLSPFISLIYKEALEVHTTYTDHVDGAGASPGSYLACLRPAIPGHSYSSLYQSIFSLH
jgi:hypothetical protein